MTRQSTNNDIIKAIGEVGIEIGSVKGEVTGIKEHLGKLNGSVAKLQDAGNAQAVINAQTALVMQNLTKQAEEQKNDSKSKLNFWHGIIASIAIGLLWYFLK